MRTKRVRDPYAPPKAKSPEQALSALMALCAKAEKSSGDALRLMARWSVEKSEQEGVLRRLIDERFIDDERYAAAFVREKININGWGKYKIQTQLRQKGVAQEIIDEKLSQLDRESMAGRLLELLTRRCRTVKYSSKAQLRDKLLRYGASLGYDFSSVSDAVREVISNIKDEEDEECFDF